MSKIDQYTVCLVTRSVKNGGSSRLTLNDCMGAGFAAFFAVDFLAVGVRLGVDFFVTGFFAVAMK